jgi:hypothetical protein
MADETILVADQYALWHTPSRHHYGADPRREARDWCLASNVLGPRPRYIALVAEDDSHGMAAYRDADYEILGMNGNREFELGSFIGRMQGVLQTTPPRHLILVTTDPAFVRLCRSAIAQPNVILAVWGPADQTPCELAQQAFNFRTLEDLLPQSTTTAVDVRVDFENLYLGLLKLGWKRDIKTLVQTLRDVAGGFGDVVRIVAYGDWDWLAERGQPGLQRQLFLAGVETRYEVNIQGKNSSDMVIARDIQSMLECAGTFDAVTDIIMLGTCDRDFRPTLQLARACRKRVILLTLEGGLSDLLRVVAGNEICYLDERLGVTHCCQPSRIADEPSDDLANFAVQAEIWFRRQGQTWAGAGSLSDALRGSPARFRWMEDAIETGVLNVRVRPADGGCDEEREIQLAAGHPLVEAARHLLGEL